MDPSFPQRWIYSSVSAGIAVHIQRAEQLIDVGCIGGTVVLHKDEAGCLADVHFLAHFGAHMACGAVQGLDSGLGAVLTAHHAHIDLRHVQVGRHIQPGDGQQTALQPRVFQPSDDGDELTLHVLRQTAHIFLRHSFSSKNKPLRHCFAMPPLLSRRGLGIS